MSIHSLAAVIILISAVWFNIDAVFIFTLTRLTRDPLSLPRSIAECKKLSAINARRALVVAWRLGGIHTKCQGNRHACLADVYLCTVYDGGCKSVYQDKPQVCLLKANASLLDAPRVSFRVPRTRFIAWNPLFSCFAHSCAYWLRHLFYFSIVLFTCLSPVFCLTCLPRRTYFKKCLECEAFESAPTSNRYSFSLFHRVWKKPGKHITLDTMALRGPVVVNVQNVRIFASQRFVYQSTLYVFFSNCKRFVTPTQTKISLFTHLFIQLDFDLPLHLSFSNHVEFI